MEWRFDNPPGVPMSSELPERLKAAKKIADPFPMPAAALRKISDADLKWALIRLYREYSYLCGYTHSGFRKLLAGYAEVHSSLTPEQKQKVGDTEYAQSILLSYLAGGFACAEAATRELARGRDGASAARAVAGAELLAQLTGLWDVLRETSLLTVYTARGPKRRSVYGKTRAEAAAKLAKAIADRDGGVAFDASRITLGEYLERWLSDTVRDTVKERTLMRYEQVCELHISPALGSMQLTQLKPAHFQALYKSKMDEGLSPATVRGIHVVAHKAMKQALRWDLVSRNPASGAKPPRSSNPEVTALTREQARRLLDTLSAEGDRLEALYAVALATGLRIGELLGLRWQDVALDTDHSGGELRVRRTLVRTRPKREGYAGYAFGTPKGGAGRSVRFKAGAARHLRSHKARQLEEKLRLGSEYADTDFVFTKEEGGILPPVNVWRHFASLLKRSNLPSISFHTLRHTAATLMLENGEHPKVVQEMLGHANISQTLNTYSHVTPNMQSGAAERPDSVLF